MAKSVPHIKEAANAERTMNRDHIDHPLGPDFTVRPASDMLALAKGWLVTHEPSGLFMWTDDLMVGKARLLAEAARPENQ